MSKRLYDFKCPNDHVTESFVDSDHTTAKCKVCSKDAIRLISAPSISLDVISGDFPGATAKWANARAEKLKHEQKRGSD
jgi:hypothetical protein